MNCKDAPDQKTLFSEIKQFSAAHFIFNFSMSTANQSRLQLVWGIEALNLMFQLETLN